jgi:hypothetical protein
MNPLPTNRNGTQCGCDIWTVKRFLNIDDDGLVVGGRPMKTWIFVDAKSFFTKRKILGSSLARDGLMVKLTFRMWRNSLVVGEATVVPTYTDASSSVRRVATVQTREG